MSPYARPVPRENPSSFERLPRVGSAALWALLAAGACVPTGSAPAYDAGPTPSATPTVRPSINVMTAPFEETFDRPDAAETAPS